MNKVRLFNLFNYMRVYKNRQPFFGFYAFFPKRHIEGHDFGFTSPFGEDTMQNSARFVPASSPEHN